MEIVSDYTLDSNHVSGYYSDSSYEFDFGSDPDEPESKNSTTEQPLSGPATGLVITSTPAGRFVYRPDCKPADLTGGNSRYAAYLDSLPFQEGTPLAPTEEHTPTEVATTDSSLITPNRQVFMAASETPGPSGTHPNRYFEDISAVKDQYGKPERGGSEWEPIKILLVGDENSNKKNATSNTRLRLTTQVGQAHVATGVPLDL
jgi:hypothetical protein